MWNILLNCSKIQWNINVIRTTYRKSFYLTLTLIFIILTLPFYFKRSIIKDINKCIKEIKKQKPYKINHIHKILILAEDHRSKYHYGIDFIGIIRSIKVNIKDGKKQGASTIEQQLVRVITKRREMNLKRKLREQFIAINIMIFVKKNDIYISYINLAYYGEEFESLKPLIINNKIDNYLFVSYIKYPKPSKKNLYHSKKILNRINHIRKIESGDYNMIWL